VRKRVKVGTLDTIFSKCIRERADWICEYEDCEYCGNHSFRNNPGGLHNSHYKGRRGRITRWDQDNCWSLCNKQHEHMGDNPDEHTAWVRGQLGDIRFDELVLRANGHRKYTPFDRYEMNVHYKAQLVKMQKQRMKGEQGWLVLTSWD